MLRTKRDLHSGQGDIPPRPNTETDRPEKEGGRLVCATHITHYYCKNVFSVPPHCHSVCYGDRPLLSCVFSSSFNSTIRAPVECFNFNFFFFANGLVTVNRLAEKEGDFIENGRSSREIGSDAVKQIICFFFFTVIYGYVGDLLFFARPTSLIT